MSEVQGNHAKSGASTTWQIIGRLVAAAVVLAITAFLHLDLLSIIFGL